MPADNWRFTSGEIASLSWRNGGNSPAETAVRNWKLLPRRNVSVSRRFAKPPDVVCKRGESVVENDNWLGKIAYPNRSE